VDHDPRVEANWFCGGLNPHRVLRLQREGLDPSKKNVMKKVSYPFQVRVVLSMSIVVRSLDIDYQSKMRLNPGTTKMKMFLASNGELLV
jgi:hypothetical protein